MANKGPAFTLNEKKITDRKGNIGIVYKDGDSWKVRILHASDGTDTEKLANRMVDWYVFTQLKAN